MIHETNDTLINSFEKAPIAYKHDEHIIQNSLYGRLKSNQILCKECGNKLSKDIDSDFCKLFESFTERLKPILISKNHGNNNASKSLRGLIKMPSGKNIEVHIKSGKVTPVKPDCDRNFIQSHNLVKVFANQKRAKNYIEVLKKELKEEGINIDSLSFEIIDDISESGYLNYYFSEGIENFNSKLVLGLNKIATGFASSHGIARKNMPRTLDIKNQKIIDTENIIPYISKGILDSIIEIYRPSVEEGFPTHTLLLFTEQKEEQKLLVCYIDLFSTFQYYIILNDDYNGKDIKKNYYQSIIKKEKHELEIKGSSPKDLHIIAADLDVKSEELTGKTMTEVEEHLEKKYNQSKVSYQQDIFKYLHKASEIAFTDLQIKQSGMPEKGPLKHVDFIEALPSIFSSKIVPLHFEMCRIHKENKGIEFYRQNYIEYDKNISNKPILYSSFLKSIEASSNSQQEIVDYCHIKYFQLTNFINQTEQK